MYGSVAADKREMPLAAKMQALQAYQAELRYTEISKLSSNHAI